MATLEIKDLHVSVEGKEIIKGVSIEVNKNEVHALMGPNGSGKSTLSFALAGHPKYTVTRGSATFKGEDLLTMPPDERARAGLFLAFQYPAAVPGVTVGNFLRTAVNAKRAGGAPVKALTGKDAEIAGKNGSQISAREFLKVLKENMKNLGLKEDFAFRYLNDGFSGGEKKRVEILQMAVLKPEIAILDETDSGLDIDAMKTVSDGVNRMVGPAMGALVITHYQRLLNYIRPQVVHVMMDGRIVTSGGPDFALELEAKGYDWIRQKYGVASSAAA
ncbi:MAG: Fe-S cluster assembly ATPase SufC [Candidatus Lindowbacteria bacterium RIFCSPLOWO2_12_FULL_62_27]|nr:MAG: Fe-S cluster assembly ATPase SufC [Candidatus Lindowbacteria bacterium RIFCSPLOWO2_02_FULL_62_12]OGH62450.1 MAG: Fe-S cluster assembly ATPase SufC [Candidatus Lindowbacteria bacterium RIFCSPLOWO2_12_FULL_62_27]